MSSKPELIELSSDSSSVPSDAGWTTYYPPKTSGPSSLAKKGKGKVVDSSSDFSSFNDSLVSSYHSSSEDEECVSKAQVSKKSTIAYDGHRGSNKAVISTRATCANPITYEERIQVLGLPAKVNWEDIMAKRWKRGSKALTTVTQPNAATKGKGKGIMD